jgi:hypothetical protein
MKLKKILWLLILAFIVYFFYTRVGESSSPCYGSYKVDMPLRRTTLHLTLIEKLRPGLDCGNFDPRKGDLIDGFLETCRSCELKGAHCQDNLTAKEVKIFDNRVVDVPYFSYEKGGLLSQQDFRILFTALTETEAKGVCIELRKTLKEDFLLFLGGRIECVRRSDNL